MFRKHILQYRTVVFMILAALVAAGCGDLGVEANSISDDAALASLTVDAGVLRPAFEPSITEYSVLVRHSVETITISAESESAGATIENAAAEGKTLLEGDNVISIIVTAADKVSEKTYTVTVTRLDASYKEITDAADLAKIGVGDGWTLAGAYVLTADIELASWQPIGSKENPFTGTFNGAYNTITIESFDSTAVNSSAYIGIFASVEGGSASHAVIKNLAIESKVNTTTTSGAGQAVGLLAGFTQYADIEGITLSGSFTYAALKNVYLGGIAGYIQKGTTIKDCNSDMTMNIDAGSGSGLETSMFYGLVGGFVGLFKDGGEIYNCHNSGDVTADSNKASSQVFVGGIAGGSFYQFTTEYQGCIIDCSATGNITARCMGFWSWGGGIAGCIVGDGDGTLEHTTRIMRCFATGTVSINGSSAGYPYVGGICGYNYYGALLSQCYFTGRVEGNDPAKAPSQDYAGGISGYNSKQPDHNSRIEDCWSSGAVVGYKNAGGIVGQNQVNTFIRRCYSTMAVSTVAPQHATTAANNGTQFGVGGITGMQFSEEDDAVTGCVALNTSIRAVSGDKINRIAGSVNPNKSKFGRNLARAGLTPATGGVYTADKGADKKDGEDCAEKPVQSVYENLGWNFAGDSPVWKMGGNGYPALVWQE